MMNDGRETADSGESFMVAGENMSLAGAAAFAKNFCKSHDGRRVTAGRIWLGRDNGTALIRTAVF
jgi:hypothetical protein